MFIVLWYKPVLWSHWGYTTRTPQGNTNNTRTIILHEYVSNQDSVLCETMLSSELTPLTTRTTWLFYLFQTLTSSLRFTIFPMNYIGTFFIECQSPLIILCVVTMLKSAYQAIPVLKYFPQKTLSIRGMHLKPYTLSLSGRDIVFNHSKKSCTIILFG